MTTDLFEHILREQDGVFPAALAILEAANWDSVDAIREQLAERAAARH